MQTGCIPEGRDQEWITDLCNISYGYDHQGRYALQSKKLLVSKGLPSTDMADSLGISLCFNDNKKIVTLSSYKRTTDNCDWSGF